MRAAAERQAAEVAYVKATAAHSEARINDVELALAAIKEGPAEKIRAEREAGSAGEHAEAERREGKRRKRNEACKQEEMEDAPAGAGLGPFAVGGAPGGNRVEANRKVKAKEGDNELQGLRARVEALEKTSDGGSKVWEELIGVWAKVLPGRSRMDLSGVSLPHRHRPHSTLLHALSRMARPQRGLRVHCSFDGLKKLHTLDFRSNLVTDVGVQKLLVLAQLTDLNVSGCSSVTSASMVHVGELTALTSLRLHDSGVTEDGLQHLTVLTALKLFTVPPGVTDSGMKLLRNMKRLERLGLWDVNVTVAGLKWLNGLKSLQVIATETEDVECLIRDNFPGMIVTPGPL
ncbi:unnamed protein product [Closterium sp. NIES-54]